MYAEKNNRKIFCYLLQYQKFVAELISILIHYTYTMINSFNPSRRSLYRQIIDQIRFGIASGKLAVEQLPTVRSLVVKRRSISIPLPGL
jgi:hypothetical protein